MKQYPLARPYTGKREEQYVLAALRSGRHSMGPFVESFEKKFAQYVGTKYACAVSSGTAGLHMALLASGIGKGDEVITTPFSFIASANAILYVGAKPIFVDVDPRTFNIDPAKIERAITKRTKAILPVHIFGQCADMEKIVKIARRHKLAIVEDACESLGSTYRGKMAGSFGKSAVFAFYANKQITTGEGGMIVTDDKKTLELCRSLRNQGRGADMQWLDHERLGYNYRLNEMSAALGLAQIENIRYLVRERIKIATWYDEAFESFRDVVDIPFTAPSATNTYFVYVVRIKNAQVSRDVIIDRLAKKGIASKPYLPSIHLFDFYRQSFGFKKGDYPVSESVSASTLALPFYIGLTKRDTLYIAQRVVEAIKEYEKH